MPTSFALWDKFLPLGCEAVGHIGRFCAKNGFIRYFIEAGQRVNNYMIFVYIYTYYTYTYTYMIIIDVGYIRIYIYLYIYIYILADWKPRERFWHCTLWQVANLHCNFYRKVLLPVMWKTGKLVEKSGLKFCRIQKKWCKLTFRKCWISMWLHFVQPSQFAEFFHSSFKFTPHSLPWKMTSSGNILLPFLLSFFSATE